MKCINEPIAKRANREDGVTGCFWQGRFVSKRLLDEVGARETAIYIDLNPVRAGVANTIEESKNTSVEERLNAVLGRTLATWVAKNLMAFCGQKGPGLVRPFP